MNGSRPNLDKRVRTAFLSRPPSRFVTGCDDQQNIRKLLVLETRSHIRHAGQVPAPTSDASVTSYRSVRFEREGGCKFLPVAVAAAAAAVGVKVSAPRRGPSVLAASADDAVVVAVALL